MEPDQAVDLTTNAGAYSAVGQSAMDPATTAAVGAFMLGYTVVMLLVAVFFIVTMWKIFKKAGHPGWAALIPFYNIYIMLLIAKKPWWWLLLLFVPIANWVVAILMTIGLGKAFGKGTAWSIFLLIIFPFIGYSMLAFGSSTYQFGKTKSESTPAATT